MKSKLFTLSRNDVVRGAVMAVLGGLLFPLIVAVQTPEFNLFTADWGTLGSVAVNGAVVSLVSYLAKNFFSDQEGKVFGKVG